MGRPESYLMEFQPSKAGGFSLLELIITLAILSILVVAVVPLTKNNLKRQREYELKQNLREIRQAIDRYHLECPTNVGPLDRTPVDECYPPKFETLVEGITPPNSTRKIRYLRRMPRDPITGKEEWGFRSIQDDPKADSWGGQNIYDVYCKSAETALNGTKYKDW